ncbi:MAG: hypothetical protein A2V70_13140 [Planctomycetes bacterium RBG_13_63_9]|nr:MAG: hypothetical protein A2V70_13140 [Planctomycetes bacterium RBG_13_63_9]
MRIYLEGGGDHKNTKRPFRKAFDVFLKELKDRAGEKQGGLRVIPCGGRSSAFADYKTALRSHPEALNLLLVDSEAPVTCASPWQHLRDRPGDNWDNPGVEDKHCHLMVQTMEAWLIADPEKLAEYYGQGFNANALPRNPNVEEVDKCALGDAMDGATRNTRKGRYHKTRHAPEILERIRPNEVRVKAKFCERLFSTLLREIEAT